LRLEKKVVYKIIIECIGVPPSAGSQAATDITNEFYLHRPWHQNVNCTWNGTILQIEAENEFDHEGLALLDEFSDSIDAYISVPFDGEMRITSISKA
jgi:hypothetical protein